MPLFAVSHLLSSAAYFRLASESDIGIDIDALIKTKTHVSVCAKEEKR